ncbi:MAG: protein-glutamate O-methyltransferase CheR [Sulfuritalea sp.]|jgi:chemotaxis protein methyltransferase CheR|nr:protein-glutamate O-methyltransferase CheR [Sulfuritalea sp.]
MTAEMISDHEFSLFQELMHTLAGVYLPPNKKSLVWTRLSRRLRDLDMNCLGDYFRSINSGRNPLELQRAVDLLTTHETYFFREPQHFDFLVTPILSAPRTGNDFRVWSAASSTGEEAYSIAMLLMQQLGATQSWQVFGSDISIDAVEKARAGIYRTQRIEHMPDGYLQRYCLRGIGREEGTLRIKDEVIGHVRFAQINLNRPLPDIGTFDVIFLRNVLIYFDTPTRQQVVERLVQRLKPKGWLFIGHSENLGNVTTSLRQCQPSIYRRT